MYRFALLVASALGFALTAALGNMIFPLRRALWQAGKTGQPQPEQAEQTDKTEQQEPEQPCASPQTAPPLLGGLCLMVGVVAAAGTGWAAACAAEQELLFSQLTTRLVTALGGALLFGAVGAADDIVRARSRSPLGLRRWARFALEACAAAIVLLILYVNGWLTSGVMLPALGYVGLGELAPAVWWLLLVALAECARVSDGAAGTVCGTAFVAMLGLICVLTLLGVYALAVLPAALAGALMAFLLWNFPPARLCPGSGGCLFAASLMGCMCLSVGWPELALPLALPFWLEGGMVALQVAFGRFARGKLLFSSAPLHRWLQKRGVSDVGVFYIMCALAALGAVLTVKFVQ